jgi:predicted acetyltransferase
MSEDYGIARGDELADLIDIEGHAFVIPPVDGAAWIDRAGADNLRVLRRDGQVAGGLVLVPMGQFFGGRSVPMTGVAGVGVRLDVQRRGVATALMRGVLGELAERGVALSALFASTRPLYRKVGYEPAGARYRASLSPQDLAIDERGPVRRLGEDDHGPVRELYRAAAAHHAGHLDRGDYVWHRLTSERAGARAYGVAVDGEGGALEGYLFYRKVPGHIPYQAVEITDLAATTPRAWRRLWSFVRDLSTRVVDHIAFYTAPSDPGLLVHPDPRFAVALIETWMLRVVDARAALIARGYPPDLRAELALDVVDPLLPRNAGRIWLRVADGVAAVEPGGPGRVRLDVGALAALYAGFLDPRALAQLGRVEASPTDLAAAAAVFAGPAPWMREIF